MNATRCVKCMSIYLDYLSLIKQVRHTLILLIYIIYTALEDQHQSCLASLAGKLDFQLFPIQL